MLLVVLVVLVVTVLSGAAVRLPVHESHPPLGVVGRVHVVVVAVSGVVDVALRHDLQVRPDAVVAGAGVIAEVHHAALVGALVSGLHSREAEFMGDVASYNLHDLATRDNVKDRRRSCSENFKYKTTRFNEQ